MNKNIKTLMIGSMIAITLSSSYLVIIPKAYAENEVPTNINNKSDIVDLKDPQIKYGITLSLWALLGHVPTEEDYTQENLDKIKYLVVNTPNMPETLSDLEHLPNLEDLKINYSNGDNILDSKPISSLTKLKSFDFESYYYEGGGLDSFKPFENISNLKDFKYTARSSTDNSEYTIGNINSLENIDYYNLTDDKRVNFGNLDNLPNLTNLNISHAGLKEAPTLKSSDKLESINLDWNDLNSIPDMSNFSNIKTISLRSNNISDYANIDTIKNNASINLINNILTSTYNQYDGSIKLNYNFIADENLQDQMTLKNIKDQSIESGKEKSVSINWIMEDGSKIDKEDLTSHQMAFMDLDNLDVSANNNNVSISKNVEKNTLLIKGLDQGNSTIKIKYGNQIKYFNVNVF